MFTRKLITTLCMMVCAGIAYGKSVDQNTAQTVAYNFMKGKVAAQSPAEMTLVYTGTTDAGSGVITDLYIFNWTAGAGFVIVSADDNVMPVLGYSTESNFTMTRPNASVMYMLSTYENQIAYAIQNNVSANMDESWNNLKNNIGGLHGARTTATTVSPMLAHILWDQENPYGTTLTYNADCPYDNNANPGPNGQTLTGCVATAMSEVMKYWNWPDTGIGSHTYTPSADMIPSQTANFAVPFYFDSMQTPSLTRANTYAAQLLYFAGVSVNMTYGTDNEGGSGAYVTSAMSPITNCAEYALKTYFRYPNEKGYTRRHISSTAWLDSMTNQMNLGLPVIYAGSGNAGGHCWVMDGYDNDSFFHFNWGWSGYYNGYFTLSNLTPNGDTFNSQEEAIINIIPDTPVTVKDTVKHTGIAITPAVESSIIVFPNPASNEVNVSFEGVTVTNIMLIDIEGRLLQTFSPANNVHSATLPVNELPNGMYLLKLQTGQGVITRKFVINK